MLKAFVVLLFVSFIFDVGSAENSICQKPAVTGYCRASFTRYAYDQKKGTCVEFIYGGCGENENNFETLKECRKACP